MIYSFTVTKITISLHLAQFRDYLSNLLKCQPLYTQTQTHPLSTDTKRLELSPSKNAYARVESNEGLFIWQLFATIDFGSQVPRPQIDSPRRCMQIIINFATVAMWTPSLTPPSVCSMLNFLKRCASFNATTRENSVENLLRWVRIQGHCGGHITTPINAN